MPPWSLTASTMELQRRVEVGDDFIGVAVLGEGGEVADVEDEDADVALLGSLAERLGEELVDDGGRDVLAEEIDDARAFLRLPHGFEQRGLDAHADERRGEAAEKEQDDAEEKIQPQQRKRAGPSRFEVRPVGEHQRAVAERGEGAGEEARAEFEAQRGEDDVEEIAVRRGAVDRGMRRIGAGEDEHGAGGQRHLDERADVGCEGRARAAGAEEMGEQLAGAKFKQRGEGDDDHHAGHARQRAGRSGERDAIDDHHAEERARARRRGCCNASAR